MGKHKEVIETLLNVYDKEGKLIPFMLNPTQQLVDSLMDQHKRISILKARQKGCSTYIMARFLVDCLNEHSIVAMLAHDKDHTEKLLRRAQELITNMNGPQPKISRTNDNEIYFQKTQSQFYIGTAGSSNFGRSATITHLHQSEIAFWKDPKRIRTGLLQAIPKTGTVVEETTANGYGTWFQRHYYSLKSGRGREYAVFIPWNIDIEYTSQTPLSSPLTPEELSLQEEFQLTNEHLQWRREKIEEFEGDESLFKQEYPLTIDEAFRFTGGSLFPKAELWESENWVQEKDKGFILLPHPIPDFHYVLGADSSGGTGHDEAAICVVCVETNEQVYEFGDNKLASPYFAPVIERTARRFNNAYIVPEANSHGLSTIAILKNTYPTSRIFSRNFSRTIPSRQLIIPSITYGWQTTKATKAYCIGVGQLQLDNGLKLHSHECISQLRAFTEDEQTHEIINEAEHDDRAMAFLLACMGLPKVQRQAIYDNAPALETISDKLLRAREILKEKQKLWRPNGVYQLPFESLFDIKGRNKRKCVHVK